MRKNIILCLAAVLTAISCVKGPDMPMQTLAVDKEAIMAPSMGAEYTLYVDSNTAWKMKDIDAEWIVPSVLESVGSSGLVLTIAENNGEERAGTVCLASNDNGVSAEIKIVQSGAEADGFISISALRQMEKADASVTVNAPDLKIKGFVVTDAAGGNWLSGNVAVEDSFKEPNSGMNIQIEGECEDFAQGEEIAVAVDKAILERNADGFLTLVPKSVPAKTESTPVSLKPFTVKASDIAEGLYESMYVKIDGFQPIESAVGGTFGTSPVLENEDAENVRMMVSGDAVFSVDNYNPGVGSVCGIAGPAGDVPGIWPLLKNSVSFSEMRIGVKPGIRKLPYVFSFYCYEQTNKMSKYLRFNTLDYNANTQLLQGTIAEELDETKGVWLDVTAYGSDKSKIYGPNYWAEPGAHDNINTSGFVSLECKTTPTAECGWMLNVPLQMEMPADFNVSFGLSANNKYTLGNWAVSWSLDKTEWNEAGRIVMEKPKTGGSYYLYFTVPVHMPVPAASGSMLYIKIVPKGSDGTDGYKNADGHGSSCYVCLHSAIILSHEEEGNTAVPAGAVYFEPFDKLTAGMDYFVGDMLGGLANYCADGIDKWSAEKKRGLTGSFVMERPGYAQIGYVNTETAASRSVYVNNAGSLTTPALGRGGDLNLSFKACTYRTPAIRPKAVTTTPDVGSPDITSVVVEIIGGGTVEGRTSVTVTGLPTASFKTFHLKIDGATPNTQICFTSAPEEGGFSRWFIDDILVTE